MTWEWKVWRLRRRWDRARERALLASASTRKPALEKLDAIAGNLVTLEETQLSRRDRHRLFDDIVEGIAEAREIMRQKQDA